MNRVTIPGAASLLAAALLAGCVAIPAPASGRGTLWGYVRAVPRDGVSPAQGVGGPYGDRRLRDVQLVDYQHPGFVVVYLDSTETASVAAGMPIDRDDSRPRGATTRVTIQASAFGPRFAPRHAAIAVGDTLVVKNADSVAHTITAPDANLLHRLPAGAEVALASPAAGTLSVFLLDVPHAAALVFVAPGPYSIATADGRWELRDLRPGRRTVHAWHPRLPAGARQVDVAAGGTRRLDLQIGVGNLTPSSASRPDDEGAGGGKTAGGPAEDGHGTGGGGG